VVKEIQAEVTGVARGIEKKKTFFLEKKNLYLGFPQQIPDKLVKPFGQLYIYIYMSKKLYRKLMTTFSIFLFPIIIW